ncbi:MAG TPA: DUF4922 domain-containing protein, partial [Planctomycetia bacterium]|nr:DUF4922 domain-containing protein [Planctomycetia bacterium]
MKRLQLWNHAMTTNTNLTPAEFAHRSFRAHTRCLNRMLRRIESTLGLGEALERAYRQHVHCDFIQETQLADLDRRPVFGPNGAAFWLQMNPLRAARRAGAGRALPPPGVSAVHENCFLCLENLAWQQRGLELPYRFTLAGAPCAALPNPFPFVPVQFTIATEEHRPQAFENEADAHAVIAAIVELARRLGPSFMAMMNGEGAGASIPRHRHFHVWRRWAGSFRWPLETAARGAQERQTRGVARIPNFPMTAFVISGASSNVVAVGARLALEWREFGGPEASFNLAAAIDADGQVQIYFT